MELPMIIVDNALRKLQAKGRPIRVGMIGAGFQGKAIAFQIMRATPGVQLCAIANRHIEAPPPPLRNAIACRSLAIRSLLWKRPSHEAVQLLQKMRWPWPAPMDWTRSSK
jgi:hypothetical protein